MVARTLQALPAAVGAEYGNLGTWGRGSMGMLWAGLGPVKQVWIYEHPMHPTQMCMPRHASPYPWYRYPGLSSTLVQG